MARMITIDIADCTGCGLCEVMCAYRHERAFVRRKARLYKTVFFEKETAVPVVCRQCENAWCEEACPTDAISRTVDQETGAPVVVVDEDECTGCEACVAACPYGSIVVDEAELARKCDLCGGAPECVKFCRAGALHFVDVDESVVQESHTIVAEFVDTDGSLSEKRQLVAAAFLKAHEEAVR